MVEATRATVFLLASAFAVASCATTESATTPKAVDDGQPITLINQLRGVHPMPTDEGNIAENHRLDELWVKKLTARKADVVPVLRAELEKETKKPSSDQFFLLDAAHFLQLNDPGSRALVFSALEKIDPAQAVINPPRHSDPRRAARSIHSA